MPKLATLLSRNSRSWNVETAEYVGGNINGGFIGDKGVNNEPPGSVSLKTMRGIPDNEQWDASNWEKFKLLLWKNYKIQFRHKVETLLEIILPILFTVIVVIVRCVIESKVVQGPITFPSFRVNEVPLTAQSCCNEIYYAPNNSAMELLMQRIHADFFNKTDFNLKFTGFSSENELVEKYSLGMSSLMENSSLGSQNLEEDYGNENEESKTSPVLAGIVFTNDFTSDDEFPPNMKYKIRFPATPRASSDFFGERFGIKKIWYTESLYPVVQILGPRAVEQPTGGVPGYFEEGFLYIQYAVETTLAKILSQNETILDNYDIKLQRFPYPTYIDDKFMYTLQGVLPLTLILSFIFPVINITKLVLVEKEKRLKEYMKMMGLVNWIHWMAWFIKSFLFLAISALIITILLKIRLTESQILEVLPKSDPTVVYFALLTHIFQLVCFSFFISTLFKTANSAAIVAAILWFLFFIPFAFLQPRYNIISRAGKIAWSFGTNMGICWSCQLFCIYEGTGLGVQWNTVFQGATPNDFFCLGDCMLIMIFNGVLYLTLTIYVESVWPGEFGIPLPWYFPFTKWYWTGNLRVKMNHMLEPDTISIKRSEFFESMVTKSKPGVQIKGLTKKFDTKVAVKNLHLNMYENEVLCLCGHNGSGKTTTMSILSGIIPSTSGTAIINGYDICKDMKAVRKSIGLCPQENVLFGELTVEEHLRFYTVLKGLPKNQVEIEVQRMIKAIGLQSKKNVVAASLSGGMKRKLSLGIAFCANSKVVLLDEPSSGLDPSARRAIWDVIENEKKGRTILLSTHYLDEADIVGDRIAILAGGELQCYGSSLFLKKKYGCGYHLVIVKNPGCNVQSITDILRSKLDDVEEEQNVGSELSYALPDNKSHLFANVFQELESKKEELGIASYGAQLTTLEEVFIRVGQQLDKSQSESDLSKYRKDGHSNQANKHNEKHLDKSSDTRIDLNVTFLNGKVAIQEESNKKTQEKIQRNSGIILQMQQFLAMILKKFTFTKRKYGLLIGQIAICLIYPSAVLFVLTTIPGIHDPIPHPIVLDDYELFGKVTTTVNCPDSSPTCFGYKRYLESKEKIIENIPKNQTVSNQILKTAEEKSITLVNFKYYVGYEENETKSDKTELIGFFNNQPLHTPPLALSYITNGILNSIPSSNETFDIQVTSHPFAYGANWDELGSYFTVGFQVGVHFSLAIGFSMAIYTIFPIKERSIGSKHLQFVSGVNFIIFWMSNFIVDLVTYFLPCLTIHLVLIGYQVQDFYNVNVQLYILLLLYCYAFAILPLMYLSSLLFEVPSSGLVGMGVLNVLTGYASLFVSNVLSNPEFEKDALTTTLHRIFLAIPTYSLGNGITQISLNYQVGKACNIQFLDVLCETPPDKKSVLHWCCNKLKENYLDWDELGIGKNLVYLTIFGVVCWILLLIIDSGIFSSTFGRLKQKLQQLRIRHHLTASPKMGTEDEDVKNERKRIDNEKPENLSQTDNLVIRDLTKIFPNCTVAVNCLTLGVKKGECFGLLGANGAGKTSTFKMLTGELSVTGGDAYVCGQSIRIHLQQCHKNIGYAPQFDSLIDEMTGRETLQMYCRLRGIPEKKIRHLIIKLAEDLLFTEFLDRVVKTYSGGNKRKLSTAVALVGNPPLVFLDEPSAGVDPVARRHLWDCIAKIRDAGTSVVLTSHSMEETEFLCTKLAIMVNGKFRCLGSPQQLKSKFGEGYTLTAQIKVTEGDIEDEDATKRRRKASGFVSMQEVWSSKLGDLRTFIENSLSGCTLEDIHQGFLHYRVNSQCVTWAQMFTVMEAAKEKFNVEAYSVGQTSLEQVFLNFIKAQYNAEE